ncbi:hypothetical protein L6164_026177 [Bauhinia variegata]|uniref:Uncharacterized protein n=1 Tax=Bauhinia variegata TaxID=167791 RepID=A0ACB9LQ53_BAUVA|nr:hypothetical protein L6164_026177 [Bauhinia variegata]
MKLEYGKYLPLNKVTTETNGQLKAPHHRGIGSVFIEDLGTVRFLFVRVRLQAVIFSYINMDPGRLDPNHSGEIFKHLDKQNELLGEAYKSMLNEVQKLQVEEEMLMRKLYEIMSAQGLTKKSVDNCNASYNSQGDLSNATVDAANEEQ